MADIKNEVLELKAQLDKLITSKDGVVSIAPDAYMTTLPADVTPEMVEAVYAHNSVFYPAATMALGEASIGVMKANKKIDHIETTVPMAGKNVFDFSFDREKQFPNVASPGDKITKQGCVTASVTDYPAKASRGEMNLVRAHLAEMAMAAFK